MSEAYDDLEMHYLNVELDIPQRQFGVPTGQYLAWLIQRGWASDELNERADELTRGTATGCSILWDACDGKLIADDLSDAGNRFTAAYFVRSYFNDYIALFCLDRGKTGALYEPADTAENAALVSRMLDARVRALSVTASLPARDEIHVTMMDAVFAHLSPLGFEPSDDMSRSERHRTSVLKKRFRSGVHTLSLGTYVDRQRGHHGLFADFSSSEDRLAAALRLAYTPDERASMGRSADFIPLRMPMHAWTGTHPLLVDCHEGVDRWDWLGRRRQVVLFPDADAIPLAVQALIHLLDRDLLPRLADWETPAGVAALRCRTPLRTAPANFDEHDRAILVAAEVAGLANLPALCDEMTHWLQEGKPRLSLSDRLALAFIDTVRARSGTR